MSGLCKDDINEFLLINYYLTMLCHFSYRPVGHLGGLTLYWNLLSHCFYSSSSSRHFEQNTKLVHKGVSCDTNWASISSHSLKDTITVSQQVELCLQRFYSVCITCVFSYDMMSCRLETFGWHLVRTTCCLGKAKRRN